MTQIIDPVASPPAEEVGTPPAAALGTEASVPSATPETAETPPTVAALAAVGRSPIRAGFSVALGVLLAVAFGLLFFNIRSIVASIFIALFITVGLDPLLRLFQRHGMKRSRALLTVILLIVALTVVILWFVIPLIVTQISFLITYIPEEISKLSSAGWFDGTNAASNGVLGSILAWVGKQAADPATIAAISGGAIGLGVDIFNGLSTGMFIAILTLYFVASYDHGKEAVFRLVKRSHRATFISYANRILENVGKYLSGMVILAFINAVFSTTLLLIVGVPGAFLIGLMAFFVTMIPLIGTILTTTAMTLIALLHSPTSALIVLIAMLIYMQVEAYLLTPKVMSKAVKVPGSIVLISALAGAALFGLIGALVAIPIAAAVILLVKEIVLPAKELS